MLSLIPLLGPSRRVLDLSSCVGLTNRTLQAICTYLTHLSVLRLAWCKELRDWGLLGLGEPSEEPAQGPQVRDPQGHGGWCGPWTQLPSAPGNDSNTGERALPTATPTAGASGFGTQGPSSPAPGPLSAHAAGLAGVGSHSLSKLTDASLAKVWGWDGIG